jgi:N-acetylglutamate synthase-like GNAT family acetyltransferase
VLLGIYQHAPNVLVGVADVQTDAPQPGAAAILLLLISAGFQHQGYGQDCMSLLQEWLAAEHDIEWLWAVATDDESGLRFLRNQGFETAEQPAVPPIGVGQAFWMRRAAYR